MVSATPLSQRDGADVPAAVDTRDMTATGMLAGAGGAQPMAGPAGVPDMDRVFKSEAENLSLSDGLYSWVGHGIEDRVLKRFNRA